MSSTEQPHSSETNAEAGARQRTPCDMGVKLHANNGSEQAVLANYTSLEATPGLIFIDFGFIEPALISAVQRGLEHGGPLPERINGRLAARVAVGLDVVAALHLQLGAAMEAASKIVQQQIAKLSEEMKQRERVQTIQ